MARKKMTTYVDEELLRSAKILAAKRDGKIYEVFEDALIYYLDTTWRRRVDPKRPARRGPATARTRNTHPGRGSPSFPVEGIRH
jgi:hypothetical protein